jgi:hypothetical protein
MYVVIVCANCAGASQVEEAELGQAVQCPLCGTLTVARTPQAVLPVAKPVAPAPAPAEAPLSLDDAPQLPPPPARKEPVAPPAKTSPLRTYVYTGLSLFFTLALIGLIYGFFRYGNADIPQGAWHAFRPPEGRCAIDLPGEPDEEDVPPEGYAVLGGKRFKVNRWFERVELEFGWIDLDADQLLQKHFDSVVFDFLRREMKRLGGELSGEHTLNFVVKGRKFEARRFQGDTPKGKTFVQVYFDADPERLTGRVATQLETKQVMVFMPAGATGAGAWAPVNVTVETRKRVLDPGQHLRLYFAAARGKKLRTDTPWLDKFFTSFAPE